MLVGDTGFEPVTSSVSRKRATAAPIARGEAVQFEVGTGFEPVYTDLQSVASPLGQPTVEVRLSYSERTTRLELATSTLARLRSTN